jgi:mannose-6-phosphate isomerase
VHLLHGAVRTYAWRSRTTLADFTGRPSPTAHPEAELWLRAHPGDPARLVTDEGEQSLQDTLRADPNGQPGVTARARFDDTLPFLMKVLVADEPLSLQAHPSAQQAVEGVAPRGAQRHPGRAPLRNYRNRSHKPELLVALGRFEALAGIPARRGQRRVDVCAGGFRPRPVREPAQQTVDADSLRALFTTSITAPQPTSSARARGPRRRDPIHPSGAQDVRHRSQDGARVGRALPRMPVCWQPCC